MPNSDCPVCRTADIVCGKWTLLVIRDLAEGRSRFCELERSLAGISPRTLSLRLRALEEEGIVERQTFPEVPPRVEYALTEKGRALVPIVESMRVYGREWLGADGACVEEPERPSRPSPPDVVPSGADACNPACAREEAAPPGRTSARMHNRALHDSLAAFVEEAAWQLAEEVSGGAEVPVRADRAGPRLRAAVLLPAADRPLHRRPLGRAGQAPVLSRRRPGARPRCPTCRPICRRAGAARRRPTRARRPRPRCRRS